MFLDIAREKKGKLLAFHAVIDLFCGGEQGKCLQQLLQELAMLIRIGYLTIGPQIILEFQ